MTRSKTARAVIASFASRRQGEGAALPELSLVTLQRPAETLEGDHVPVGRTGTIVYVHGDGEAYEVEFNRPQGVATVRSEDLRPHRP